MSRYAVVSSYCVLIVIQKLKSLKFYDKENSFQTHAAGFILLPYLLDKGKKVAEKFTSHNSIETR